MRFLPFHSVVLVASLLALAPRGVAQERVPGAPAAATSLGTITISEPTTRLGRSVSVEVTPRNGQQPHLSVHGLIITLTGTTVRNGQKDFGYNVKPTRLGLFTIAPSEWRIPNATPKMRVQLLVSAHVVLRFPPGVTFANATPEQLAAAVQAAIAADPAEAEEIIMFVFSQFTADDAARADALIAMLAATVPPDQFALLVNDALASLSDNAQGALTASITQTAASQVSAGGAVAPGTQQNTAPSNPGSILNGTGPGGTTNPANFNNTGGQVNSPSA